MSAAEVAGLDWRTGLLILAGVFAAMAYVVGFEVGRGQRDDDRSRIAREEQSAALTRMAWHSEIARGDRLDRRIVQLEREVADLRKQERDRRTLAAMRSVAGKAVDA